MEKEWLKAPENGWQFNTSHRLMQIPEEPKRLMKMLMDAGYEAFVVGGCVRDSLIGRTPHDWDICTNALPDQMKEVFSDFRVLDTGLKHGTLTVLLENPDVISITVTKQTPNEYFKSKRKENRYGTDC